MLKRVLLALLWQILTRRHMLIIFLLSSMHIMLFFNLKSDIILLYFQYFFDSIFYSIAPAFFAGAILLLILLLFAFNRCLIKLIFFECMFTLWKTIHIIHILSTRFPQVIHIGFTSIFNRSMYFSTYPQRLLLRRLII